MVLVTFSNSYSLKMDEKIDVTSCCRLCLSTKLTFNIHTSKKYINSDLPPLDEIIKELTTIQIEKQNDASSISNNICFSCNYLIIKLYSFRQQSIISNQKFQEAVKTWKKNQVLGVKNDDAISDIESKNLLFADSLVSIYARCLARSEKKSSHSSAQTCKLSSKNNLLTMHPASSNLLADSAFSVAFNDYVSCSQPSNHPYHPSVNRIIEENPNIIIPDDAINYNYDCSVVIQTFKQLLRAALCPQSKISNEYNANVSEIPKERFSYTNDYKNLSASVISLNSNSDVSSNYSMSESHGKNVSEKCLTCKRQFSNMLLLEDHVQYCHKMPNEAIVLTTPLRIPKKYKYNYLSSIKLVDNEECLRLQYNCRAKKVPVPKLIKNKNTKKANSTITFKTLDIAESDTFLQKLISDTIVSNIPVNSISKIPSPRYNNLQPELIECNTDVQLSSTTKPFSFNSVDTPSMVNSLNDLHKSNLSDIITPTSEAGIACSVVNTENIAIVPGFANTSTVTPTEKISRELYSTNKAGTSTVINEQTVANTTCNSVLDYEARRKKMLKSSLFTCKENTEISNLSSSALLCQKYLPSNRPIINNDTIFSNVPQETTATIHQETPLVHPTTTVSTPTILSEILKPNFYVDKMVNNDNNVINNSNLKRKNDEISPSINPKRSKISNSNSKRIFKDLEGCTNILEKLFLPQINLEEILRKDLTESNFNEIDTSMINAAVSGYLRKNPRHFNLLEQLIGIRDLPVVVNILPSTASFDFVKAKFPDKNSETVLVEMSKINWNNTCVLENFLPNNKYTKVMGKSWQKKKINVPLSNWKQCATEAILAMDQHNPQTIPVDFENLIDKNLANFPNSYTSNFTNNSINQLSNASYQSLPNSEIQTSTTQKKFVDKLVYKRVLKFSGKKEKLLKPILPRPGMFMIKEIIPRQKSYVTIGTNHLSNMECTQNGSNNIRLDTNLEESNLRNNNEIIEIEDDSDMGIQYTCENSNKDAIINSEPESLQIISVMSLNDDYNSSLVNTQKMNGITNGEVSVNECSEQPYIQMQTIQTDTEVSVNACSEPYIAMQNVETPYEMLNADCNLYSTLNTEYNLENLSTSAIDNVSNSVNAEMIDFSELEPRPSVLYKPNIASQQKLNQSDPPPNKPSNISVLSPTRINLLLKKKELKV